jgi:hypothetical protein
MIVTHAFISVFMRDVSVSVIRRIVSDAPLMLLSRPAGYNSSHSAIVTAASSWHFLIHPLNFNVPVKCEMYGGFFGRERDWCS